MEYRDTLKYQAEQLGKILSALLESLMLLKSKGELNGNFSSIDSKFQGVIGLNLNELLQQDYSSFRGHLIQKQFQEEHFEVLSRFFYEKAMANPKVEWKSTKQLLEKSIDLLDMADEISQNLSIERMHRKGEIETIIEDNFE